MNDGFLLSSTARFLGIIASLGLVSCTTVEPVALKFFTDFHDAMLVEDMPYSIGDSGDQLVVPAGFVTDLASIPVAVRPIFEGDQSYQYPAIVHDYLYWKQSRPKDEADKIFLMAMEECGVGAAKRHTIYEAVHLFGQSAWEANWREKNVQHLPKIIPRKYRHFPAMVSWADYRKFLYAKGVRS
jgi:uncharacterized protein DUF1353